MKLYSLILIAFFCKATAYDSEQENYDDLIERQSSLSSPSLVSAKPVNEEFNLKLIKTDLRKYLQRLNFNPSEDTSPGQYILIEDQVASKIQRILLWIKKRLYVSQDVNIITDYTEFQTIIDKVVDEFHTSIGPNLLSLIGVTLSNPQENAPTPENSTQLFMLILDNYFKDQLLKMGFCLLRPIPKSKLAKYQQMADYKRLQNNCIIETFISPDNIESWQRKRYLHNLLYKFTKVITLIAETESEIFLTKAYFKIQFDYDLNYEDFPKFYANSREFLTEKFNDEAATLQTPEELNALAQKYIDAGLDLHKDYQGAQIPEGKRDGIIATITPYLAKFLADMHISYFQHFDAIFCRSIKQANTLEQLISLTKSTFQTTAKIHQNITQYIVDPYDEPISMYKRFQTSIYLGHIAILECIENLYLNRNVINKITTNYGGRTSSTRNFLETLKQEAREQFPFLFSESSDEVSIIDPLKALENKMDEADESPVKTVTTTLSNLWQATGINSWFPTSSSQK